jgi:hypothetical protein
MEAGRRRASYLVECFWPSVGPKQLADVETRVQAATSALRRQGRDIDFVGSILVIVDESVFYLFDGCETEVRSVSQEAGIPFERVLETVRRGL